MIGGRFAKKSASGTGWLLFFARDGCVDTALPRLPRFGLRLASEIGRGAGQVRIAEGGDAAVTGGGPYFRHDSFTEFSPSTNRKEWRRARRPL